MLISHWVATQTNTDIPFGGSALQCAARTPHDPSHPSPTGDLTGKALAEPPHAFILYSTEVRVRTSPSETRRERRSPPGGLTIDGRLTPEACGVL